MSTDDHLVPESMEVIIDLFAWAYDVTFRPDQRAGIQGAILQGLSNSDASDEELMRNLVEVHNQLVEINHKLKAEVQDHFQTNFNLEEGNDRSRILVTVYRAIVELLSGGSPVSDAQQQGFASTNTSTLPPAAVSPSFDVLSEKGHGSVVPQAASAQPAPVASGDTQPVNGDNVLSPAEALERRKKLDREQLIIAENAYYWQNYMDKWKSIFGRM